MYYFIYAQPIYITLIALLLILLLWSGILCLIKVQTVKFKTVWHVLCSMLFHMWLAITLNVTIFSRFVQEDTVVNLIPFSHLFVVLNGGNPELLRTDWMNLLLFVPCGMLLSEVFGKRLLSRKGVIAVVLAGFGISVFIELLQFFMAVGAVEFDDVLFNTLGTLVGCIPLYISKKQ